MKKVLNNLEETKYFGEKLGALLKKGDLICLNGDLGAGKTTFTKSIGQGMGIKDYITSPTFSIINEYYGILNLYHFDTYRLENEEEVFYLGLEDYFYGDGVCIIEWANRIKNFLPEEYLDIYIKILSDGKRELEIIPLGKRYKELLEELQ